MERNSKIEGTLDILGPEIIHSIMEMDRSVRKELDKLGPRQDVENAATLKVVVLVGGLFVFAGSLAAFFLSRSIVLPLNRVTRAAYRVASGDMDMVMEPAGPAELARLQESIVTRSGAHQSCQ